MSISSGRPRSSTSFRHSHFFPGLHPEWEFGEGKNSENGCAEKQKRGKRIKCVWVRVNMT